MDIKKPQLVKVGAFAYFFEGVLQHPPYSMRFQMCAGTFASGGNKPPLHGVVGTPDRGIGVTRRLFWFTGEC